jgi:peptidoglycan/xylan/chitin deacetylase (PgdA/CDA1 family)
VKLALTFDDGPSRWTPEVLDVLARHDVRATFFVIGAHVRERRELVRRLVAEGHEVGNHTDTHPRLTECDDDRVVDELTRGAREIERAVGVTPLLFRAPYFALDDRVRALVKQLGLVHVGCTIDPRDWTPGIGADEIADAILDAAHDAAIVDLHDGRPSDPTSSARTDCTPTVAAVARVVPLLQASGYELVCAGELL